MLNRVRKQKHTASGTPAGRAAWWFLEGLTLGVGQMAGRLAGRRRLGLSLLSPPPGGCSPLLPTQGPGEATCARVLRVLLLHRQSPAGCFQSQDLGLGDRHVFPSQAARFSRGRGPPCWAQGPEGARPCIRWQRSCIKAL